MYRMFKGKGWNQKGLAYRCTSIRHIQNLIKFVSICQIMLIILSILKLGYLWVMSSVWDPFVSVFCSTSVCLLSSENDLKRQSVTEPEPMSSLIDYPA